MLLLSPKYCSSSTPQRKCGLFSFSFSSEHFQILFWFVIWSMGYLEVRHVVSIYWGIFQMSFYKFLLYFCCSWRIYIVWLEIAWNVFKFIESCSLEYGLSFCVHLQRMCILLMLAGMLQKYQLGKIDSVVHPY